MRKGREKRMERSQIEATRDYAREGKSNGWEEREKGREREERERREKLCPSFS